MKNEKIKKTICQPLLKFSDICYKKSIVLSRENKMTRAKIFFLFSLFSLDLRDLFR